MTQAVALTLLGLVELLVAVGFLLTFVYRRYRRLRGSVALEAGRRAALLRWLDSRTLSPHEAGPGGGRSADDGQGAEGDTQWRELHDKLRRLLGSADPYDPAAWGALLAQVTPLRAEPAAVSESAVLAPEGEVSVPETAASEAGAPAGAPRRAVVGAPGAVRPGASTEPDWTPSAPPSADWRTANALQDLRGQVEGLTADKEYLLNELRTAREALQERENALSTLNGRYEALQCEYVAVFDRYAQEQPGKRAG